MCLRLIVLIALAITPAYVHAQKTEGTRKDQEFAVEELETVLRDASRLEDKLALVNLKSRAANLISLRDPIRSQTIFLALWKFVNEQTEKGFDKDRALNLILRYLYPRNPRLAKQLLSERQNATESTLAQRATGRDENLRSRARLASQLVESDPTAASELLEESLSKGVSPAGLGALLSLRERDSLLSDFVTAKVMEGLARQSTLVSLPGLHILIGYVFPELGASAGFVDLDASLQSLQFKYFSMTYDVLKASLAEPDDALIKEQGYTAGDLHFRAMYQGEIATILAALAPRFQSTLAEELNVLAARLSGQLPPNVAQLSLFTAARLRGDEPSSQEPEATISLAISRGDFDRARKSITDVKSEEARKAYDQLVAKLEVKSLLAKSDIPGAVTILRTIEDQNAKLGLYLEALKTAQKKRDSSLAEFVINDARTLIPQVQRNGLHVRALLAFAAQLSSTSKAEAVEFLNNAINAINALSGKSSDPGIAKSQSDAALEELNDPRSLLEAAEMERAFSSMATVDFESTLEAARRIQVRPVQLIARLETIEPLLKRSVGRSAQPPRQDTPPSPLKKPR